MRVGSFTLIFVCLVDISTGSEQGAHWCYDSSSETGPEKWSHTYKTCGGKNQSPINIQTARAQYDRSLGEIEFNKAYKDQLNKISRMELTNNGHSANLKIEYNARTTLDSTPTMSGGGLPGTYRLLGIHGHWGSVDERGSEHTVNGKKYSLELHLVHMNTKYETMEKASTFSDGLAVLAVFCKVSKDAMSKSNEPLGNILELTNSIVETGKSVNLAKKISPFKLLPINKTLFYRYNGSLTTPPCTEAVVWTVYKNLIYVSQSHMEMLRKLTANGQPLVDNFRPVQRLNGRTVLKSYNER